MAKYALFRGFCHKYIADFAAYFHFERPLILVDRAVLPSIDIRKIPSKNWFLSAALSRMGDVP